MSKTIKTWLIKNQGSKLDGALFGTIAVGEAVTIIVLTLTALAVLA